MEDLYFISMGDFQTFPLQAIIALSIVEPFARRQCTMLFSL